MNGSEFIDALRAKVSPSTIDNVAGTQDGVTFTLSDGRKIVAKRREVAALRSDSELAAYVQKVLA